MEVYFNAENLGEDTIPVQFPLNEVIVNGELRLVYQLNLFIFCDAAWEDILLEVSERKLKYVPKIKGVKLLDVHYDEKTNMSYVKATLV